MREANVPRVKATMGVAIAVAVAAVSAILPTATARAAETATIAAVSFTETEIASGSHAEIRVDWTLPDNAAPPASLTVPLPAELRGLTDSFEILDPSNAVMGTCQVTAVAVDCVFDDAYVLAHPLNLRGTFNFWVEVTTEVTEQTTVTYDFGGVTATVEVAPPEAGCEVDCVIDDLPNRKSGVYDRDANIIYWQVDIAAPAGGSVGGEQVVVTERLGAQQAWIRNEDDVPDLHILGTNQVDANGYPTGWADLDERIGAQVTEEANAVRVEFTAEAGWFYLVTGYAQVTNGGAGSSYSNAADIAIGVASTETVSAQVIRQGGGGTGAGDDVGALAVVKAVEGNGADRVAPSLEFTVTYSWTGGPSNNETGTGSLVVRNDNVIITSDPVPVGAVVTLSEASPPPVDGIKWETPVFSSAELTITETTPIAVTLTNYATLVQDPVTSPDPGTPDPGTPDLSALASSGGEMGLWVAAVGTSMIVGGALLLFHRKRAQLL